MKVEIVRKPRNPKAVTWGCPKWKIARARSGCEVSVETVDSVGNWYPQAVNGRGLERAATALRILNGEQTEVPEGFEVEYEEGGEIKRINAPNGGWLLWVHGDGKVSAGVNLYTPEEFGILAGAFAEVAAQVRARQ